MLRERWRLARRNDGTAIAFENSLAGGRSYLYETKTLVLKRKWVTVKTRPAQ